MANLHKPGYKADRFSTRTLLYCAVFAGIQALTYLALSPATATLATLFPPAYAVAAGAYSAVLFAARLFIDRHGTATLTAALTGFLVAAVSPIGLIVLVPLLISAATFDLVLYWRRRTPRHRFIRTLLPGAMFSAVALFLVSLPAFSPGHLTPTILGVTLLGRVVGQIIAVLLATAVVTALARAGVRPPSRTPEAGSSAS